MYLSKIGFFKKKIALEEQQLLNYLNLLTTNLKSNNLKKIQLAYLQQGLSLLTASAKAVKQRRFSIKLKYTLRKRKAKKRFLLKTNHHVEFGTSAPQASRIPFSSPALAKMEVNKQSTKNRIRPRVHP
ncbi:hypothetical protein [Legionella sp.]|uniref:hypothetical protein n=1 Tax=Legionella sp. TaxID=459 RepID=UPI00321FE058